MAYANRMTYRELGARAFREGFTYQACPLYKPDNAYQWREGWRGAELYAEQEAKRDEKSNADSLERDIRREIHDLTYRNIADSLKKLGINPYELRDYLAGLPD